MPFRRTPRYLVVVRSDRPDVYEHLHALATPGVDLLWDRRRGERRAAQGSASMERRTRARRREPPDTWTILGFCIGRRQEPPA